jgi:hypothetical protein
MANTLLTETHCACSLVVVLVDRYGFEFDNHRCRAHIDYFKKKMFVMADVYNGEGLNMRRFCAELTFDDLQKTVLDVQDVLAAQVQSQVFATWSAA